VNRAHVAGILSSAKPITVDAVLGFGVEGTSLVKAADGLSGLIASRYPDAVGAS
jgi:hypothetical protein